MACQLILLNGPRSGTVFDFQQPSFWLGRDPRSEMAFDPLTDLTVSGRHCEIRLLGDAYSIVDASSNGTFLNGQAIKEAALSHGDILELGRGGPQLRFAIEGHIEEHGQPAAPVAVAASPAVVPAAPQAASQSAPNIAATRMASSEVTLRLTFDRLPQGLRYDFSAPVVRIGRDPSADIPFDPHTELLVSYNHAKVVLLQGKAVLFDLDSTNGTFVNGQRVARQDLVGGEVLEFGQGGPQLRLTISAESAATAGAGGRVGSRTVFGGGGLMTELSLGDAELLAEVPFVDKLSVGRDERCDITLDSMYVSHRHCALQRHDGTTTLSDLGSANGLYLAGERIDNATLTPGAEFVVGPYVLKYVPDKILVFDTQTRTWIDAHQLSRIDGKTKRRFMDRISLRVQPGEFVCVLGPSGCGKSTLLKALNGSSRADEGSVFLNNVPFYENYEALKHQVGYVPQDDIIHSQLSIERTLRYAARLRLPKGISSQKREERIRDVLSMLELYDHRRKVVSQLSGGQRKRVSIAVELLTEPAIIFLDEPTSGLDPNLEEKMMLLLRELTQRGKTVVTVTHTLDNIHLADKVAFLVDGRLVFFGGGDEALSYFKVERLPEVYKRFEERKGNADSLRDDYLASPLHHLHIGSEKKEEPKQEKAASRKGKRKATGPGSIGQFFLLTRRYFDLVTRDTRNTAILLAQAPLVALFVALAVKTDQPERGPTSTMFLIMSLSALWFGCSNAARELTKEAAIYARERMVNLRVIPYVASKFFVLQWLALLQVGTMLTIVYFLRAGYGINDPPEACTRWGILACSQLILDGVPGNFWMHLLNLYLTALNGIGLGLLISAIVSNSDKAMSLVPLLLIPQVLFSGSFGIPSADETVKRGVGYGMALNWSLDQAKRIAMCSPEQEKGAVGCSDCLHAYDPFKYRAMDEEDQDDDARCAAILSVTGQLVEFPENLQLVEDGFYTLPSQHKRGPPRQASKSPLGLAVLGGYDLLLFILVCIFVRLKDRKHR
jgi:ABC transport system ATP-binding/permease protein